MTNCGKCGYCCSNLCFTERIKISLHTRSFMLSTKCKFLNNKNQCDIYYTRPKLCQDWKGCNPVIKKEHMPVQGRIRQTEFIIRLLKEKRDKYVDKKQTPEYLIKLQTLQNQLTILEYIRDND